MSGQEAFSDVSSEEEEENKSSGKKENKMTLFKTGLTKKMVAKDKNIIVQMFNNRKSPEKHMTSSTESLNIGYAGDNLEKEPDSKLRKLKTGLEKKFKETGLEKKFKDIREDIVDIRDEKLHSLNELKEEYQEKAEAKKAIITSFTEEEVRGFRKGSPLIASQVTKQMSSLYLSRRFSSLRLTVLGCRDLGLDKARPHSDSLFVKLGLGSERWRSRMVPASECPVWRETTCMARQTEEDSEVKVELFARGPKETYLLGSCSVPLSSCPPDTMQRMSLSLGDQGRTWQKGVLDLVLWVTGVNDNTGEESPEELSDKTDNQDTRLDVSEFSLLRTLDDMDSVGVLEVKVLQATGLGSSKIQNSANNSFVMLELDNLFHRTKTVSGVRDPVWDKSFTLPIRDSFSLLRVSVLSEKLNSTPLVLGKCVLRLSQFHRTPGVQDIWVGLKNRKLRKAAKGEDAKLRLQINYVHNVLRSAVTVFRNKEELLFEEPKPKFERTVLLRNVTRIKRFLPKGSTIQKLKQSYTDVIAWTNPARTVKFFVFYMFFVYYFQLWWVPAYTFYHLVCNYRCKRENHFVMKETVVREESIEDDDDEDEPGQEEKKSLKQSLDSLQNLLLEFQEGCGVLGSYLERVSNMAHFEEPFLSFLFCCLLLIVSLVLWLFGLRTVLLLWGVNKFTKKLRDPDPVPTNEVDNLLLRVPDYEVVEDARRLVEAEKKDTVK